MGQGMVYTVNGMSSKRQEKEVVEVGWVMLRGRRDRKIEESQWQQRLGGEGVMSFSYSGH